MDATTKIVLTMYKMNKLIFQKNAKFVLKHFYYIPLEESDLISECLRQLIIKANKFEEKEDLNLENFLFSNIKFTMFTYCRFYIRNNNKILNNYVPFESIENIKSNTYNYFELDFDNLTPLQKNIIDDLYIKKMSIRQIAIKNTTTSNIINQEIKKIRENFKKQKDNFIDW